MKKLIVSLAAVVLSLSVSLQGVSFAAAPVYAYKYDANNRLLSVTKDGVLLFSYIYDNNGNLLQVVKPKPIDSPVKNLLSSLIEHKERWTNEIWYSVNLNWQDDVKADKYNIYSNSTLIGSTISTSFETKSLDAGTYKFYVVPIRGGIEGQRSSEIAVTVPQVSTSGPGGGPDL